MKNIIILAAGKHSLLKMVRGRPVISWVLSSLRKGVECIIVVRKDNYELIDYLKNYNSGISLNIVEFNEEEVVCDNILYSLYLGLKNSDLTSSTQIILGDSYIENISQEDDVLMISKDAKSSSRWCLVSTDDNGYVEEFFDKVKNIDLDGKELLVGCYNFSNTKLLKDSVYKSIKQNQQELSDAFMKYAKIIPLRVVKCNNWYDLKSSSGLANARTNLFSARSFNYMTIDNKKGIINKTSNKKNKLKNEYFWMTNIPKELAVFVPRIFSLKENKETVSIEMELYGYPNLSEFIVSYKETEEDFAKILNNLFDFYSEFRKYRKEFNQEDLDFIYVEKTQERMNLLKQNKDFKALLSQKEIIINDVKYMNLPLIELEIKKLCDDLCKFRKDFSIVHGDFCFSNILFDKNSYIFKLIDPRGGFKNQSLYGDPRYDIAKLRHSVVGLYDFICLGFYTFKEYSVDKYDLNINFNYKDSFQIYFDNLVEKYNYNLKEIKIIEALLFLTMIPLHEEDLKRQKAFYLIAIQKFNEVIYEKK